MEESAVDDLVSALLRAMHYVDMSKVVRTRKNLTFIVCGNTVHAQTDVCLMDSSGILLLVQEDKGHNEEKDPEPQLIAEAIAAFYYNNFHRVRRMRLPACRSHTFAGITMEGATPTFYKIPVTEQLEQCVQTGMYPTVPTIIKRCVVRCAIHDVLEFLGVE
ncbi:hypothetical protein BKA93DRAFT_770620 [Sparassis latifolia]